MRSLLDLPRTSEPSLLGWTALDSSVEIEIKGNESASGVVGRKPLISGVFGPLDVRNVACNVFFCFK